MHEKAPLRHGWGGNNYLRETAQRRRVEEAREMVEVPEKFDSTYAPQEADYRLLLEIQQSPR